MRFGDDRERNLFSRLTSLTVADGSRKIENFCTETLAWCLLVSPAFRRKIFARFANPMDSGDFYVETQHPCKFDTNYCYIDLLIHPKDGARTIYVIEVKVLSEFSRHSYEGEPVHQLEKYRRAIKQEFPNREVSIVSLTVDENPKQADKHLHWDTIETLLRVSPVKPNLKSIFIDFAEFLKRRNMAAPIIKNLNSSLVSKAHQVSELQSQFERIFDRLAQVRDLKSLLRNRKVKSRYDPDPENNYSWFGFEAGAYYVGIGFLPSASAPKAQSQLWIELYSRHGDNLKQIRAKLSRSLKFNLTIAESYWPSATKSSPSTLTLIQPITPEFNGNATKMIEWFRTTLVSLEHLRKPRIRGAKSKT
jgi:hypothetical protein